MGAAGSHPKPPCIVKVNTSDARQLPDKTTALFWVTTESEAVRVALAVLMVKVSPSALVCVSGEAPEKSSVSVAFEITLKSSVDASRRIVFLFIAFPCCLEFPDGPTRNRSLQTPFVSGVFPLFFRIRMIVVPWKSRGFGFCGGIEIFRLPEFFPRGCEGKVFGVVEVWFWVSF